MEYAEESSTDYESGAKMIEGLDADTVQIVSENELKALKTYVEKNKTESRYEQSGSRNRRNDCS